MRRTIALLAVMTAATAAHAMAQSATPPAKPAGAAGSYLREVEDEEPLRGPGGLTVRRMEDMTIVSADGRNVGEVEEVVANNHGKLVGLTAEVGGFLGVGDREVLIPIEHLSLQNNRFRTKLTEAQLKALPGWDDD